jgi:phage shock protein PspC (stress-responsive transcriptional regulator)
MRKFGSVSNYFWINLNLIALIFYVLIFFPMFDIVERAPAAFIV